MSTVLKRFGGIAVAIIVALGWWGFSTWKAKADAPNVGECVTVSGSASDADVKKATCGDDDVLYKVMSDDGECDATEVSYTVEVRGNDAVSLCLFWQVKEGDCIKQGTSSDTKVSCDEKSTPGAPIGKVVSVEDSGDATCGKGETPFANAKRSVTVCLVENL